MTGENKEEKAVQSGTVPVDNSKGKSEQTGTVNAQTGEQNNTDSYNQNTDTQNQDSGNQDSGNNQNKGADAESKGSDSETGTESNTNTEGKDPTDMSTQELLQTIQQSQQQQSEVNQKLNALLEGNNQEGEQQAPDYDAALSELDQQLQNGDINIEDYQSKQRQILEQKFSNQMNEVVESKMEEQRAQEATQKYLENNPDYPQYANSDVLQQAMQENPILDEVSAYERIKRQEAENRASELQQQLEQMKQQQEQAAKNGAQVTDTVGKEPGSEVRRGEVQADANKGTKEGMLDVLTQVQNQ